MLTFNHRVAGEYEKIVNARIEQLSGDVLAGMLDDMGVYRALTGEIRALRQSVDLLNEAIAICEGKH